MTHRFLKFIFAGLLILAGCQSPVREDKDLLINLMRQYPEQFEYVLNHTDSLEIQVIYTQINRDAKNRPSFRSFYFNFDSTRYFYPASTVKFPLVLLSLEKLKHLGIEELNRDTPMFMDSAYSGQETVRYDSSAPGGLPTIAHYARKIFLVSDNNAFNRLYAFMGQRAINETLQEKGYDTRILQRLERGLTADENRHTEAVRFMQGDHLLYEQPMQTNDSMVITEVVLKGRGYMKGDSLIRQPFDFTQKNFFPLSDQQRMLKSILFPESVPPRSRFDLTEDDRRFVLQYMSQKPRESDYLPYHNDSVYYDALGKFLMFGEDHAPIPPGIRIFNKIGGAYGYLIDNAYVVDFDNKVEFLLSAVILSNSNGIFNDDHYEYHTVGYPFLKDLGQLIYHYELQRTRTHTPDLSEFVLSYDH